MARPNGFEPLTPKFVVSRSAGIQVQQNFLAHVSQNPQSSGIVGWKLAKARLRVFYWQAPAPNHDAISGDAVPAVIPKRKKITPTIPNGMPSAIALLN